MKLIAGDRRCDSCGEVFQSRLPWRRVCPACRAKARDEEFVEVYRRAEVDEAKSWVGVLESHGIASRIAFVSTGNDDGDIIADGTLRANLSVPLKDAERAVQLIEPMTRLGGNREDRRTAG
jgi:hypothetical protein